MLIGRASTHGYTPRLPPRLHQWEGIEKANGAPGFAWFMEMGTGKTCTDLTETGALYYGGEIDAHLILAPKGVYTNWETDELPKHWPEGLLHEDSVRAIWRGGGTVANRTEINSLFQPGERRLRVMSMNIEALGASDKAFDVARLFVERYQGRIKISVDESTAIKNPDAARTKALYRLRDMASHRRVLCGQPVPNGPLDIFSQMDWAVPGCLGRSFYGFRARYAVMQTQQFGQRSVKTVVGYRDLQEVAERIKPHSFRKKKEECLDLPPQIYLPLRQVELTPEQRRVYNEVRDNATSMLSTGEYVSVSIRLVQNLRLQQIVCGHVVDEEGRVHRLPSNRPAAMMEQLEEFRGSGIIWATFHDDIERIEEELVRAYGRDKIVFYHGRMSQDERDLAKKKFQDGYADWFVGTPQAASRGLTLVRTPNSLYYSNSHNMDHRDQSESRTHRDGQHWPCVYADLTARDTNEWKVIQALRKKMDLATVVMSDNPREWLI